MNALPNLPEQHLPEGAKPRGRWKRILGWIAIVIASLIVLLIVAVVVLLHSRVFHQYILKQIDQRAASSLGTAVAVRDFTLHWSGISPAVDLYDVVVQGAPPYSNIPLLTIDHLGVQVKITSIVNRTWHLQNITIDHPVARVFVDQQGRDNLPTRNTGSQSSTNVFDLGIRHAVLTQGEIFYNDQKSSIAADLNDVQFRSAFNTAQKAYSGTLQYTNGELKYDNFRPLPHDLRAQFMVTPTTFTLDPAVLTTAQSSITLVASLTDYSHPRIQARYNAVLNATQIRRTLGDTSLPTGLVRMAGTMQYASQPGVPMLDAAIAQGELTSPVLQIATAGYHGDIRDLRAHYRLANGRLLVSNMHGQVLGGNVTGDMNMDLAQAGKSDVNLQLHGASLAQLQTVAPQASNLGLGGTANVDINANWNKSLNNLVANVTAVTSNASVTPPGAVKPTPVTGRLQAQYSARNSQLTLGPTSIRTPQGALTLSGALGTGKSLQVNMNNVNLQQIASLLPPTTAQSVASLGLAGTASFVGTVTGTVSAPKIQGLLTAKDLQLNGTTWSSARAVVNASPKAVTIQNARLQSPAGGQVAFNLSAGLSNWKLQPNAPLSLKLNASRIKLASLEKVAGKQLPASGTISAIISLSGSETHPVGQGTVILARGQIKNQPIQSARLNFQANGEIINGDLNLQLPGAGGAQGVFTVNPQAQTYNTSLQANGIRLEQLQAVKSAKMEVSGTVNLTAQGQGSFKNPELQATLQAPLIVVNGQNISNLNLQANVASHIATLALDSRVINTPLQARARVDLNNNYYVNAAFDTPVIPLRPLIALYAPSVPQDVSGQTELHGTINGPLATPKLLNAQLTIPTLQVQYGGKVQLASTNPINIHYANGVLTLQRANIRGTDTDLEVQGTIPMTGNQPMSLLLRGTVNLQLAQAIDPNFTTSGQAKFNINSYGARTNPNVEGQVEIVDANFASGSLPIGLQNGNGILELTKDRLNVKQFTGTVGGGNIKASGGVIYSPKLQFDLAFAGRGIRFLYPEGVREAVDANMALTGNMQQAMLRGQVRINQLSLTPDFDLTKFIGQFTGQTTPPPTRGFAQNLQLDVALQTTSGIHLVSRNMSLQAGANMRVTGTAADPVLLGRVNVSSGDVIFHGDRFVLQGGTVDFINPTRTEPMVNLAVNTTIDQYNIYMRFDGPIEHMRTNYSSDPSLPPADIINLIAFGRTMEASAANPAVPGTVGAESLIASQVTSQVTSRVEKIAGISQLSVDPVLGGYSQTNPGARITLRQRVTSSLFVTFATDITSTQRQVIQVQYQVTPRVSVSGTRDQNGGFGFDTLIHKSW